MLFCKSNLNRKKRISCWWRNSDANQCRHCYSLKLFCIQTSWCTQTVYFSCCLIYRDAEIATTIQALLSGHTKCRCYLALCCVLLCCHFSGAIQWMNKVWVRFQYNVPLHKNIETICIVCWQIEEFFVSEWTYLTNKCAFYQMKLLRLHSIVFSVFIGVVITWPCWRFSFVNRTDFLLLPSCVVSLSSIFPYKPTQTFRSIK